MPIETCGKLVLSGQGQVNNLAKRFALETMDRRTLLWYLVIVITFMGLGGAKRWVKVKKDGGNIHRWLFETWLFDCEPIRNIFYLPAAIFEIPRPWFIIKPPACIGPDVSIETYQLLLLFTNIISPWLKERANRKGCQHIFTKLWPPPSPTPPVCPHLPTFGWPLPTLSVQTRTLNMIQNFSAKSDSKRPSPPPIPLIKYQRIRLNIC